jgi:hypothetical protein
MVTGGGKLFIEGGVTNCVDINGSQISWSIAKATRLKRF